MLIIITVAATAAVIVNYTQHWELWVPPLIIIGLMAAWALHISQHGEPAFRENYYLIFSMLVAFYHGVHATSFFDISVVSALLMVSFAALGRKLFLLLLLAEFFLLMIIQTVMAAVTVEDFFDSLNTARVIFHTVTVVGIFKGLGTIQSRSFKDREELEAIQEEKEALRTEMEDFLVNISHELRTPVNVINGMSSIILKREEREDVEAIKDAGRRLSRQIEDIQDYSEVQRGDVVLEEERYMISSVLNDVVSCYRVMDKRKDLELLVDLDPTVPAVLWGDAGKLAKILRHLLDNSVKFTRRGGILIKVSSIKREYGINLLLEVSDTGIGMKESDSEKISGGLFQANKKRNRSTGGVGLGLAIVYGFVRKMNGFVSIESKPGKGTTVRVSIAQKVMDMSPSLAVNSRKFINAALYMVPGESRHKQLKAYYRDMAKTMAAGLRVNLYFASGTDELRKLMGRGDITHLFTGEVEYEKDRGYLESLASSQVVVSVICGEDHPGTDNSQVHFLSGPVSAISVIAVLNDDAAGAGALNGEDERHRVPEGIRALVVDDEPMNLVVATGLFKEYRMKIDTAESGAEAIEKYATGEYDVVFMDHMMPEMDGVEAMKRIRETASGQGREVRVIALTANAISGAREMFIKEGFDGFLAKPINIKEFEHVIVRVLSSGGLHGEGGTS